MSYDIIGEEMELYEERYVLALERIKEAAAEQEVEQEFARYFHKVADFLLLIDEQKQFLEQGGLEKAPIEELQKRNATLYEEIQPANYENSYLNPAYAVKMLGEEFGAALSFVYTEMRSLIGFVHEKRLMELVIRMEFLWKYTVLLSTNGRRIAGFRNMRVSAKLSTGLSVIMQMWLPPAEPGSLLCRMTILLWALFKMPILQMSDIYLPMANMWVKMN